MTQLAWGNVEDVRVATARPLQVVRPCPCGCDQRDGYKGVGYITGQGFTIWIEEEPIYQAVRASFEALGLQFES